jgi:hypothetical protein
MLRLKQPSKSARRCDEIAQRRASQVADYINRRRLGCGAAESAKLAGLTHVSAWRWSKAFLEEGPAALRPNLDRCGRHTPPAELEVDSAALTTIAARAVELESLIGAWREFAEKPGICPEALSKRLSAGRSVPPRLWKATQSTRLKADLFITPSGQVLLQTRSDGRRTILSLGGAKSHSAAYCSALQGIGARRQTRKGRS